MNLLSDAVMGRDIDWEQTFATMGVDFLFSLFLNGKSGDNAYVDPATGKNIDIPTGKTLADIDPETANFYKALGDTKLTGEMDSAIGDIYMQYMDIPESVVSNKEFAPMETAYRKYEAHPTIENAASYLEEASKVYDLPGVTQYTFDPKAMMNAAIDEAYNARVYRMLDETSATGKAAGEYAQSRGVASTLTDTDAAAGLTMKMDGDGDGGYNRGQGSANIFESTPELENHIQYVDTSVPRSRGIGGAHNIEEFFKNDINIVRKIPSEEIPGVTYYEYTMPLLGKDGKPIGGYGTTVFYKTVYDPRLFAHDEYMKRGLEAANNSYMVNGELGYLWEGYDSQGVKWIGYGRNGKPTSFFPDVLAY